MHLLCNNITCIIHAGIIDNPRQSIFTYGPSGDWETYYHPDYNPAFTPNFSSPVLEEQAHDVCGEDKLCLFDIAATGNVDIGSSTMNSVQEQEFLKTHFIPSRLCTSPHSGKLSREKTFTNFTDLMPFVKVFSTKMGVAHFA